MKKKIVVCPDSFKGSLSAQEITRFIADEIKCLHPDYDIIEMPMADGGEGTAFVMNKFFPLKKETFACNPIGDYIPVYYFLDKTGEKAFIESAQIIGLPLVPEDKRDPTLTSTFGLGEIIKEIAEAGIKDVTIALGGSATCDGGIGMLRALGFNFYDSYGNCIIETETNNKEIVRIEKSFLLSDLNNIKFSCIVDVDNPLLGRDGSSNVFAPQKGAKPSQIPFLETRLDNLAKSAISAGFKDETKTPGAGAAGGLGFAFASFFNASLIPGSDYLLGILGFDEIIKSADMIITGEGKIDSQSFMGKNLSGVLRYAEKYEKPVIALGGVVEDLNIFEKYPLLKCYEISDPALTLKENMLPQQTFQNILKTIKMMSKSNIF